MNKTTQKGLEEIRRKQGTGQEVDGGWFLIPDRQARWLAYLGLVTFGCPPTSDDYKLPWVKLTRAGHAALAEGDAR